MPGQLLGGLAVYIYISACKKRLTLDLNNVLLKTSHAHFITSASMLLSWVGSVEWNAFPSDPVESGYGECRNNACIVQIPVHTSNSSADIQISFFLYK